MIKIALKHLIYEICIERVFSAIRKNFRKKPELSVGAYYNMIRYKNREGEIQEFKRAVVLYEHLYNGEVEIVIRYDWPDICHDRASTGIYKNQILELF